MVIGLFPYIHTPPSCQWWQQSSSQWSPLGSQEEAKSLIAQSSSSSSSCSPTCIIILSSMRSGSVGIAGHLGPIPPAAGKTPRDHLQFEATPSSPLPFLGGLNWPHSSLIALHASDLRPPNRTVAKLPLSPVLRLRSISSSQEFTFSAFVALLFLFPIAIVSPWFFAIPCFAAVLEADGGWWLPPNTLRSGGPRRCCCPQLCPGPQCPDGDSADSRLPGRLQPQIHKYRNPQILLSWARNVLGTHAYHQADCIQKYRNNLTMLDSRPKFLKLSYSPDDTMLKSWLSQFFGDVHKRFFTVFIIYKEANNTQEHRGTFRVS